MRDYIQRFNDTKVKIVNCPDVISCNAFRRGLIPGSAIYVNLTRKKPVTTLEALQRAQTFVTLEEEIKEDMYRAGREGRLTSEPNVGSTRPDTNRSDKARHDNYWEYNAEPRNNCSDRTFKDSRGNEDKPRDLLKKFELKVSPNQRWRS